MAISSFNTAPTNGTTAQFVAWGQGLSLAIRAVGLVQTADTGQINWGTVAAPTTANQSMGYEIYCFGDSLQATAPFFFKIEYGSGGATANPSLWITTGTGSNGAGALTNASKRQQVLAGSSTTTTYVSYVSGANNRLVVAMFGGNTSTTAYSFVFGLERSHAADGTDTGEFLMFACTTAGYPQFWAQLAIGTVIYEADNLPGLYTVQANTQSSGNICLIPITPVVGYGRYPMRGLICGKYNDWTAGDNPSITLYPGSPDGYVCIKNGSSASYLGAFGPGTLGNYCALLRYD
jgi:hypothetical protein